MINLDKAKWDHCSLPGKLKYLQILHLKREACGLFRRWGFPLQLLTSYCHTVSHTFAEVVIRLPVTQRNMDKDPIWERIHPHINTKFKFRNTVFRHFTVILLIFPFETTFRGLVLQSLGVWDVCPPSSDAGHWQGGVTCNGLAGSGATTCWSILPRMLIKDVRNGGCRQ